MFRFTIALFFLATSLSPLYAQTYQLQQAEVTFEIDNAGMTVKGKFDTIPSMSLSMPGKILSKMKLSGSLASASINTGISIRDKHLKRSDYFYVEKYPIIQLESTGIGKKGNTVIGTFNLHIKQTTKAVTIPITTLETGGRTELTGIFTINRQDFGLGDNSMILSDNVRIYIRAVFQLME